MGKSKSKKIAEEGSKRQGDIMDIIYMVDEEAEDFKNFQCEVPSDELLNDMGFPNPPVSAPKTKWFKMPSKYEWSEAWTEFCSQKGISSDDRDFEHQSNQVQEDGIKRTIELVSKSRRLQWYRKFAYAKLKQEERQAEIEAGEKEVQIGSSKGESESISSAVFGTKMRKVVHEEREAEFEAGEKESKKVQKTINEVESNSFDATAPPLFNFDAPIVFNFDATTPTVSRTGATASSTKKKKVTPHHNPLRESQKITEGAIRPATEIEIKEKEPELSSIEEAIEERPSKGGGGEAATSSKKKKKKKVTPQPLPESQELMEGAIRPAIETDLKEKEPKLSSTEKAFQERPSEGGGGEVEIDPEEDFGSDEAVSKQMNINEQKDENNDIHVIAAQEQSHFAQGSEHIWSPGPNIHSILTSEPENEFELTARGHTIRNTNGRENFESIGRGVLTPRIQMLPMVPKNVGQGTSNIPTGEYKEKLNNLERQTSQLDHVRDILHMRNDILKSGYDRAEFRFNRLRDVFRLSYIHLRDRINMYPCAESDGAVIGKERMQELVDETLAEFEHQAEFIAKY